MAEIPSTSSEDSILHARFGVSDINAPNQGVRVCMRGRGYGCAIGAECNTYRLSCKGCNTVPGCNGVSSRTTIYKVGALRRTANTNCIPRAITRQGAKPHVGE